MFSHYSLKILEGIVNYGLSLDPNSVLKLKTLEGKVLSLKLNPLPFNMVVRFLATGISFSADSVDKADVVIIGSIWDLLKFSYSNNAAPQKNVDFQGNIDCAVKIKELFMQLEIDWEQYLSQYVGDVVAYQMGLWARNIYSWNLELLKSFTLSLSNYVQEETRLLPSSEEVYDFCQDVDVLVDDFARFEAQVNYYLKNNRGHI